MQNRRTDRVGLSFCFAINHDGRRSGRGQQGLVRAQRQSLRRANRRLVPCNPSTGSTHAGDRATKSDWAEVTGTGGVAHVSFYQTVKVDFVVVKQGRSLLLDDAVCSGKGSSTSIYVTH
jgi:hypothetical protein